MLGSAADDIPRMPASSNSTATALPDPHVKQRTGSRFENLRTQTQLMLKPPHKVGQSPGPLQSLKAIVTSSCKHIYIKAFRWTLVLNNLVPGLNLFFPFAPLSVRNLSLSNENSKLTSF